MLKNQPYSIGLDIGTSSVGWAVLDDKYNVCKVKGKDLIGTRLFTPAETATDRRQQRSTRRRLSRRRWRIRLLNDIFSEHLTPLDPSFLARLKYSWVHPDDAINAVHYADQTLFSSKADVQKFYTRYPTIYHLRHDLMTDDKKHDLREVYLAIHHIVKYRGHFLYAGESFQPRAVFESDDMRFVFEQLGVVVNPNVTASQILQTLIMPAGGTKKDRRDAAVALFDASAKNQVKSVLDGLLGNQIDFTKVFWFSITDPEIKKTLKVNFDNENRDELLEDCAPYLTAEQMQIAQILKQTYDNLRVTTLLDGALSLSEAMVLRYDRHKKQLNQLKKAIKPKNRDGFDLYYKKFLKDPADKTACNWFEAEIAQSTLNENQKAALYEAIENNNFLPKQRTKLNSKVPYQLHLQELQAIIDKQSRYYPFLKETYDANGVQKNCLCQLIQFRVPYYVGPLVRPQDMSIDDNATNHWMIKKTGSENQAVTPWNFHHVVDLSQSGERFIKRMTGTDTYLVGEPALASHSFSYQRYNVLQELTNCRYNTKYKFSSDQKRDLIAYVFKCQLSVSAKDITSYFAQQGQDITITGGLSDGKHFTSKLATYHDFKKIVGSEMIDDQRYFKMFDQLSELLTVFSDADIILERLQGDVYQPLAAYHKKRFSKIHYTGWGKLSHKLLYTKFLKTASATGRESIMTALSTGSDNLMQLLTRPCYGAQQWLKEQNQGDDQQTLADQIDRLASDRKTKSGIHQTFRILDDLIQTIGHEPTHIYLEFAREPESSQQPQSRYDQLVALYKKVPESHDLTAVDKRLASEKQDALHQKRLYLYYLQQGRDMYTGYEIPIDRLSDYEIDHIIPQSYTRDNSWDNLVLVNQRDNSQKSNRSDYLSTVCARPGVVNFWKNLRKHGFISTTKYERLCRTTPFSEREKERFIQRSLVETRQIIKNVTHLIGEHYRDRIKAIAVRSRQTSDLRRYLGVPKNRDINDYHHAHDALFTAVIGQYSYQRYPKMESRIIFSDYDNYVVKSGNRVTFDFVVGMMAKQLQECGAVVSATGDVILTNETIAYLRRVASWKNILFTRKTHESHGMLYGETLLPSIQHDAKNKKLVPTKSDRSVTLYGGYNKSQSAYSVLVRCRSPKNITSNQLVKVTRLAAQKINNHQMTIEDYINAVQIKNFDCILLKKVKVDQLVYDKGVTYYATSSEYRHNAKQLWLPQNEFRQVWNLLRQASPAENELLAVFDILTSEKIENQLPFYQADIANLRGQRDKFQALSSTPGDGKNQINLLNDLIYILKENAGYRDPIKTYFKECKKWKKLQTEGGVKLSDDAVFVHQSPTGLNVRYLKIRELLN